MSLPRLSSRPPGPGAYTPPGAMNQWITLLAPGARENDGSTVPPSPVASTWAAIRALNGQELLKAQQIVQQVTHMVTIPYQPGLNENNQVQFGTRLFQIEAIEDPDERHIELRLLCVERNQNA